MQFSIQKKGADHEVVILFITLEIGTTLTIFTVYPLIIISTRAFYCNIDN